jgi:succinyl-CoA synthetase beta subunit
VARLHEHQGKAILRRAGLDVPRGEVATTAAEARAAAKAIGGEVMVKAQVFLTGRADRGLVARCKDPGEAAAAAERMLSEADCVLVEERLALEGEHYAGITVDDAAGAPVLVIASRGGTGVEEIARDHPDAVAKLVIDPVEGLLPHRARDLWRSVGVHGKRQTALAAATVKVWEAARGSEARACEVNPLALAADGRIVACDCRITVDDYAVFRHPELGIEFARELDRPPTALELTAYDIEKDDYRGTFYFLQLALGFAAGEDHIAFHGAGGGGSMMSMDALQAAGFTPANFCDTSGNPPASKVYRAARILLSQPGVDGYFGSGSGVASQEQFHSARGLVKAFRELRLPVPAVVRLGGNEEERAIEILQAGCEDVPGTVEAYGKDDAPGFCAERLRALVDAAPARPADAPPPEPVRRPAPGRPYTFATVTGRVTLDHSLCADCEHRVCVETCVPGILSLSDDGLPVLNIAPEDAARGKCTECLACEVECAMHGAGGGYVDLPIPGWGDA